MAVKIRLKRMGKIRAPYYRVVVMDSRTKRDGRAIEEIGKYHPTEEPSLIEIDGERARYWLSLGLGVVRDVHQIAAALLAARSVGSSATAVLSVKRAETPEEKAERKAKKKAEKKADAPVEAAAEKTEA